MKKIILMLIAVVGIISIIPDAFAAGDVIFLETTISGNNVLYGQTELTINEVIIEYEVNYYDYTLMSIIPNDQTVSLLYDTWYYNVKVIMIWYQTDYVFIALYDTSNNFLDELIIYFPDFTTSSIILVPNQSNYDGAYVDGYNNARREYGYRDGSNWITANVYALERYNNGLNENREHFGYFDGNNWLTAEQWGDARYDIGYNAGLSNEIDWWSWSTTFFLMPFRILNIQILPGVRIGYFALFSLLLGVVGWFFFIVGKGGGRRK